MAALPKVSDIFENRYELLELLGSGGIGTVFKARQLDETNRLIALKILHPQFAQDKEWRQRFLREAQALNKLHHEHIVTVYHLGMTEDGSVYLAMELIEGTTLRSILQDEKLDPARAIALTKQLCSALACMHAEGIVHRDLKPENIVIMQKPEPDYVKIIDFGLVRLDNMNESQRLTATGLLIGSAQYMSPEQCRGGVADFRSDLYSLTACFYEMITGKTAFSADSLPGLLYQHLNAETPLVNSGLIKPFHPSINEFLLKGMQKDAGKRFQSAEEMEAALEQLGERLNKGSGIWMLLQPQVIVPASILTLASLLLLLAVSLQKTIQQSKPNTVAILMKTKPQNKVRTHLDVKRIHGEELLALAEDKSQNILLRCDALLEYTFFHRTSKEGLESARKARMLSKEHPKHFEQRLLYKIALYEDEALVCNGKLDAAIPELKKLAALPGTAFDGQYILRAQALLAYALAAQGKNAEAVPYLKRMLEWPYGIDYPSTSYSQQAVLLMKRWDLAKELAATSAKIGACTDMSRTFRFAKKPDLAELCVEQGLSLGAPDNPLTHRPHEAASDEDLEMGVERFWAETYLHQNKHANEIVQKLLNNHEIEAKILVKPDLAADLAIAARKAGFTEEALHVAMHPPDSPESLALLKADLLIMLKRFDEATKYIKPGQAVTDPETGKPILALERLDAVKAGKMDYRKGLHRWEGDPDNAR